MTSFEAFQLYSGLKLHFTTDSYDFVKYQGKTRVKPSSLETHRHKFFFEKLGRHENPKGLLIANFIKDPKAWIGSIVSEDGYRVYESWIARQRSLSYNFKKEMKEIGLQSLNEFLRVPPSGDHPLLLQIYIEGRISIENMLIMDQLTNCFSYWNSNISDPIVWPEKFFSFVKYRAFFTVDEHKYTDILKEILRNTK